MNVACPKRNAVCLLFTMVSICRNGDFEIKNNKQCRWVSVVHVAVKYMLTRLINA